MAALLHPLFARTGLYFFKNERRNRMTTIAMKNLILTFLAAAGTFIATALGGWDSAMIALIIIMGIDFVTGVMVALVWRKSPKSCNGAVDSRVGFKGLCRKIGILLAVLIAVQLDTVMQTGGVARLGVILFFLGNEGISVVENLGLMGIPIPDFIKKRFEQLREKNEDSETEAVKKIVENDTQGDEDA
jgi:toxin secretion/phage lysis holin